MERCILHCDLNNFYASVERLYDDNLKGVPLAVCGDTEARHGIVLAKSEEAKALGVKTGDAIWQAKEKCPDLRVVPPHFQRYVTYSALVREIYGEYTDLVESFGMDECWLDVSASRLAFGDGVKIAEEIRRRCREELGLTISAGISFNKVFAKLGSDLKKPDAQTHITRENFPQVVWPLPVEDLLFVGPKSSAILHQFGIHTIGDLARADDLFLQMKFGKNGAVMKENARGNDKTPVLPFDFEPPMKSVGHGHTASKDLETKEEVWTLILALSQEIGEKLRFYSKSAGGIAIDVKDNSFLVRSLQKTLVTPTSHTMTIAKEAFDLFCTRYPFTRPLRSVTVRAISLTKCEGMQYSMFQEKDFFREERIDKVTDKIREKYGKSALVNARLLDPVLPDSEGYTPFH